MKSPCLSCLMVLGVSAAFAVVLPAQEAPHKNWRQFNQVFVKVIVPVTARTPKQDGPVIESWVAARLKQLEDGEYFAVTDWVPVCDGLLADNIVDNDVWDGRIDGSHPYCHVGGDIPEREHGRVWVNLTGWSPGGSCEANIRLADEPGNRAVVPVQPVRILEGGERKPIKTEVRLPFVAVLIAPRPHSEVISHGDDR